MTLVTKHTLKRHMRWPVAARDAGDSAAGLKEREGLSVLHVVTVLGQDVDDDSRSRRRDFVVGLHDLDQPDQIAGVYRLSRLDERRLVLETLTGFRRAGADIIITYHALDVARWLREG